MPTSDIAQKFAAEIVENLPGTTLRVKCLRGDAEHYITEIFRKVAREVMDEIPGTVHHIDCPAPDAQALFASALETVLARIGASSEHR